MSNELEEQLAAARRHNEALAEQLAARNAELENLQLIVAAFVARYHYAHYFTVRDQERAEGILYGINFLQDGAILIEVDSP